MRSKSQVLGLLLALLIVADIGSVFFAHAQSAGGGVTYIPLSTSSVHTWTAAQTFQQNVTVGAPTSGIALTVQGETAAGTSSGIQIRAGTNATDSALMIFNAANSAAYGIMYGDGHWVWGYNGSGNTMSGSAVGDVTITAPASGDALTIANVAGANALTINGNVAGTPVIRLNTQATTGAQTATFTAANKPGAASGSPQQWIPVSVGGTTLYIPAFN